MQRRVTRSTVAVDMVVRESAVDAIPDNLDLLMRPASEAFVLQVVLVSIYSVTIRPEESTIN